jgi:TrmH family RNA methyltransferase
MTETITSRQNERLKELRKLRERKHRERGGLFAAEGEDLLAEALRFGWEPRAVFYDQDRISEQDGTLAALPAQTERVPVLGDVLESASALGSGSRVISVFEERWSGPEALRSAELAVYLHDVADPGNVGAVLRSALALASAAVVLSPGTADPFSPKAVRASMGGVFGQPIARAGFDELTDLLGEGWRTVALVPGAGVSLRGLEARPRTAFCLGAERQGLPADVAARCDEVAHVPLSEGGPESLNVAMTATLCLYEASSSNSGRRP